MNNIILLGAPGAGKGTQAENICKELNIPTISTGNMLRAAVKAGTEYGLKAKAAMDAGALVSDDIVIGILKDRIAEPDEKADAIDKVIEIFVPDEKITQRMSGRRVCLDCGATYHVEFKPSKVEGICDVCGKPIVIRKDDEPETVKSRLDTYHKTTEPLKGYYEKQGKLTSVKGRETVEETSAAVMAVLKG